MSAPQTRLYDGVQTYVVDDPKGLIKGPAIKRGDEVSYLDKPARHLDVWKKLHELRGWHPKKTDVEGFLTTEGFMDRVQAAQALGVESLVGALHTENLW